MTDEEQTPNLARWTPDADYTASSPLENIRAAREAVRTSYHFQPEPLMISGPVWDRCQAILDRHGATDEALREINLIALTNGAYRSPLEEVSSDD